MRLHRSQWPLILLPVILAGCSTTAGSRFGRSALAPAQSEPRSIAVVGDRALPAKTGEPGAQVAADDPEPEPRRNPKTRISGRVVDDQGQPVPDVTVRLADGGTRGGKDISATTDPSGAFTLNGLRPGSTYWLVAEADDDQGPLTGRVQARTAETGVEISLAGDESGTASTRRTARPSRARPISSREELEPDDTPRINREDLLPPEEDAGPLDPGPSPRSRPSRPQLSAPEPTVGWHNSSTSKPARPVDPDAEAIASSSDGRPRRPRAASTNEADVEDDGPNPLPPAIDTNEPDDSSMKPAPTARARSRNKVSAKLPPPRPDSGELALSPELSPDETREPRAVERQAEPEVAVASRFLPMAPLSLDPEPTPVTGSKPGPPIAATESSGLPAMPPIGGDPIASLEPPKATTSPPVVTSVSHEIVPVKPASEPVFASQPIDTKPVPEPSPEAPTEYNPFDLAAATPLASAETKSPASAPASNPLTEPGGSSEVPPAPKKKWGELAATAPAPVVVEPTKAVSPISFIRRFRTTSEKTDPGIAVCQYDSRLQQINELRLPDLEGKPVRLQDIDADFVLLDFWGTWFPPCVDSIPHLIDLQKKYGPDRLKIVGIACEKVPVAQRKARVNEVSQKLGINYPVLLSGMDDKPCPVLQTLQIQSYPTMILVDREGHIRWRSVGATPATEYRLERILASTLSRTPTARR